MSQPGQNAGTQYPPHVLREYALLADGERGALIGPRGDIAWMCAPHWDSDAVFSTLIGGGGLYAVTPADPRFVWGGYYEDGSLIWRSRWITTSGIIECREALAHPGDPDTAIVLRRIVAHDAPAEVSVVFDPRAGFGHYGMSRVKHEHGCWTGTTGPLHFRWSGGDQAARQDDGSLGMRIRVEPGEQHDLVLELSSAALAGPPPDAGRAWEATESSWGRTVPALGPNLAPRDARLSYAVLAGLTSRGGGMVAAATMSLPERAQAGRNYDYRYVWIRDQCYTGQAIAADGPHPLLDDAVRFVAERILADGPRLKPAYTITGDNVPDERVLHHLSGYPGGSDKVGNWVNQQFQLDALGEALLLFAAAARHERLDTWHWNAVEAAVKAIEVRWTDADAGLWELQDEHWTHSRLMCVAGLRAIAAIGPAAQAAAWEALAEVIMADAAKNSVHPSGRWQRTPDDARVDAALLLPAIRGATDASDPRAVATLDAVCADLARHGYVYRFRHDQRPLHEAEGAFVLCGFFMALADEQRGRHADAVGWFERHKAACGPPGLFTEEFDVRQRQLRGNLPQAFVHALMFECAARLGRHGQEDTG
jgi:alpha,alpha-trehalase